MFNEKYFLPFGLSVAILLARSVISIHYLLYLSNEVHLSAIAFDSMFLPWVVKQSCFFVAPFTGKKILSRWWYGLWLSSMSRLASLFWGKIKAWCFYVSDIVMWQFIALNVMICLICYYWCLLCSRLGVLLLGPSHTTNNKLMQTD